MPPDVSLIITACGRPDLLMRTLDSFFAHLDYPLAEIWVYEDSGIEGINREVQEKYSHVKFIQPIFKKGQIVAQDTLWKEIKTPFVLTWEEDWETYKGGFIQKAIDILNADKNILQVLFRHPMDNNGHPTFRGDDHYRVLSTSYHWKGFSFSPSLKRLSDYQRIGSYGCWTEFDPQHPAESEKKIGIKYWQMGYKAVILKEGYVRHIGAMRHVKQTL